MVQIQRNAEIQINGLRRQSIPITPVERVDQFNLSGRDSPSQSNPQWISQDLERSHSQEYNEQHSEPSGYSTESHKQILENLCNLVQDPVSEVPSILFPFKMMRSDLSFCEFRNSFDTLGTRIPVRKGIQQFFRKKPSLFAIQNT